MAVFSLKIAPKHDTKNRYPSISTITAEMGGFSMIGGTMPRMSKKRKLELSFFLNDRGRVAYNDLCRKCQHECKQSFRAVVIDCPHYLSKRAKRKEKTSFFHTHHALAILRSPEVVIERDRSLWRFHRSSFPLRGSSGKGEDRKRAA